MISFNENWLRGIEPNFSSGKCDYYILENGGSKYFIKNLRNHEKIWKNLFSNEIKIYNKFKSVQFQNFKMPRLAHCNEEIDLIVLEFIDGISLSKERFLMTGEISVALLDKCADIALEISDIANLQDVIEEKQLELENYYKRTLIHAHNMEIISDVQYEVLNKAIHQIEFEIGFTHGDFLLRNLIAKGDEIYVCDWEFAGTGIKFFDLATLWVQLIYHPHHQLYLENRFKHLVNWKLVEINIAFILIKEIRIHKKDELLEEVKILEERLLNVISRLGCGAK